MSKKPKACILDKLTLLTYCTQDQQTAFENRSSPSNPQAFGEGGEGEVGICLIDVDARI